MLTSGYRLQATDFRLPLLASLAVMATLAVGCGGSDVAKANAEAPAAAAAAPPTAAPSTAAAPAANTEAAPVAPGQVPAEITTLLQSIKAKDTGQLAISEEDGQFLRLLVASTGRKRALEIGSASGYSAIWIGMGLRDTGGRLVTIEYDPGRAKEAKENVEKAGLSDIVTVISGDAFQEIPKLSSTFDCIFVDAWKRDYIKFFEMTWPRLDKGGLFLGHNVINKKSEMSDFLARISTHPDLFTSIVAPGGEGVSISWRRR
jgi:caffeoyl-CoA O-methyltransferase